MHNMANANTNTTTTTTTYSRKRKASCLEIVVSKSKERITRDLVTCVILPMLHTKFNWNQVIGELTLVCCIVWEKYDGSYEDFINKMLKYAKIKSFEPYTGLVKMDAKPLKYDEKSLRERMEDWDFKSQVQ